MAEELNYQSIQIRTSSNVVLYVDEVRNFDIAFQRQVTRGEEII